MSYRLRRESFVQKSVREVAIEQINEAIMEVQDRDLDRLEAVHQVRKRCKKLRGLIRLVRPHFKGYQQEDRCFLDAAKELSPIRDAHAAVKAFDAVVERFYDRVDYDQCDAVRENLVVRVRFLVEDKRGLAKKLEKFTATMRRTRERAAWWQIDQIGYAAVETGLTMTFQVGRRCLQEAYDEPSAESFSCWRKEVAFHRQHLRLLQGICPSMMKMHRRVADELNEVLGEEHDLVVLSHTLRDGTECFGDVAGIQTIEDLINQRRAELQAEARPLGECLFAEEPEQLAVRFGRYWETWKSQDADRPQAAERLSLVHA